MKPQSILIIDDEPDIAEVLGDRLDAWGYRARVVHSAREGYAAVEEDLPDLVILDIQMPEINGLEALMELKKLHPEMPVLILSASAERKTLEKTQELGADGFMLKPFDPSELRENLTRFIPRVID